MENAGKRRERIKNMVKYSMHEIRPNAYEIRRTAAGDAFPLYLRGMRHGVPVWECDYIRRRLYTRRTAAGIVTRLQGGDGHA